MNITYIIGLSGLNLSIQSRRSPKLENAFLEHLGVSYVGFDPENGSRTVQLARGVIFRANPNTCAVVKRSDKRDDIPNLSS